MEQMTLEQYGELINVSPITLRVWICRGQVNKMTGVKSHKKLGGAWFLEVDKKKIKNNPK